MTDRKNATQAGDVATADVDPYDAIDQALDVEEQEYDPEPGGKLIGKLLDVDWVPMKSGRLLPFLRLDVKGVVYRVPAGREVLKRRLESEKVQPGDWVGLKYEGLVASKNGGNEYHSYKVVVTRVGERGPDVFVGDRVSDPANDLTPDAVAAGDDNGGWDQPVATDTVQPAAPF